MKCRVRLSAVRRLWAALCSLVVLSPSLIFATPWYESPARVGLIDYSRHQNGGPSSSGISENAAYLATPVYMGGEQGYVFKTADLLAGDTAEKLVLEPDLVPGANNRGADVSEALGMALFGTSTPGGPAIAVRVDATTETLEEGVNYFRIENDQGISFGCVEFAEDSTYLYTDCYKGGPGNHFIYKWQVLDGLASSGSNLVHVAHWDVGHRVRQIAYARIGGKDLVYFSSNNGYLGVLDTVDGQFATLRETAACGNYGGIAVSGVSLGTPHLTVVPSESSQPIVVYGLSADGLALSGPDPIVSLDSTVTSAWHPDGSGWHTGGGCSAVSVADDESTAYIGGCPAGIGACTYILKASAPAVFNVTQTIGAHGASSDPADAVVASGASFTRTYTADEGFVIAALYVDDIPVPAARFKSSYELTISPSADAVIEVLFAKKGTWWVDAEGARRAGPRRHDRLREE